MNVTDSLLGGQYLVTWKCHTLPPKNTSIIGIVIVVVVSISQERVELCCYCIRVCAIRSWHLPGTFLLADLFGAFPIFSFLLCSMT